MTTNFLDLTYELCDKEPLKSQNKNEEQQIKAARKEEADKVLKKLKWVAGITENLENINSQPVFSPGLPYLEQHLNRNDLSGGRDKLLQAVDSDSFQPGFIGNGNTFEAVGVRPRENAELTYRYIAFSALQSNWLFIVRRFLQNLAESCKQSDSADVFNNIINNLNGESIGKVLQSRVLYNTLSELTEITSCFMSENFCNKMQPPLKGAIEFEYSFDEVFNTIKEQRGYQEPLLSELCDCLFDLGNKLIDLSEYNGEACSDKLKNELKAKLPDLSWLLFEEPLASSPNGTGLPPTPKSLNQYYYSNVFLFLEKSATNAAQAKKLMQVHLYQKLNAKLSSLELRRYCEILPALAGKNDTIDMLIGDKARSENTGSWLALTSVLFKLSIRLSRAIAMKGVALADRSVANAIGEMQRDIDGAQQETLIFEKILTDFFNRYFISLDVEQSVTKSETVDVSICDLNEVNKLHIAIEFGTSRIAKKTLKVGCLNNNEYCELKACEPSAKLNSNIKSEAFLRFDGELTKHELCRGSECLQKLSVNAQQLIDSTEFKKKFYTVNLEAIEATNIRIEADITNSGSNNQKISHRRELQAAYKKTLLSLINETSTFLTEADNQAGVLSEFNERSNLLLTSPYSSKGSENTMIYRYLIDGPFLQKQSSLFESAYQKIETQLLNKLIEA